MYFQRCSWTDKHTHTHRQTDRQTVHIPQILQQKLSLLISGKLVSTRSKLKKYKYYCEPSRCEMPAARERGLYAQTNDKRKHNCLGAQLLDGQSLRGMANGQDQALPNGKRTCSTLSITVLFCSYSRLNVSVFLRPACFMFLFI